MTRTRLTILEEIAEGVRRAYYSGDGNVDKTLGLLAELDALNAKPGDLFYFGCIGNLGHHWWNRHEMSVRQKETPPPFRNNWDIDGGFSPGASTGDKHRKTRPEKVGEARLTHYEGCTILCYWDRSVDRRGGSHSSFVAEGLYEFAPMLEAIQEQYPRVWARKQNEIVLVETVDL